MLIWRQIQIENSEYIHTRKKYIHIRKENRVPSHVISNVSFCNNVTIKTYGNVLLFLFIQDDYKFMVKLYGLVEKT